MLALTVVLCCVLYPLVLLGIGQTVFHDKAQGSMLDSKDRSAATDAQAAGSKLIAQPFTADEYFQPRPSAASYDASRLGPSNFAASNYLLRDRVARQLGPVVMYGGGPKKGQPVAPDIESWFRRDRFGGKPGIVAQWAQLHSGVAQGWLHDWVKADKLNAGYMADWEKAHPEEVARWKGENTDNPEPKPEDLAGGLAVPFFVGFLKDHPGTFPGMVESKPGNDRKVAPVKEGGDIQSLFFDLWLQEHPDVELEQVPADMVTASGSGLDPHITLQNARWQLSHRVAAAWAKKTGRSQETLRDEIDRLLVEKSSSPLGGLVGVPLVNVLEVNLCSATAIGQRATNDSARFSGAAS